MRKPLVVVCAAATAMVLGGVLVATSAGAEETPGGPDVGGWSMPDLSGLFGGDSGFVADAGPVPDTDDPDDTSDLSDPGPAADVPQRPGGRPNHDPVRQRPAAEQPAAEQPAAAGEPAADRLAPQAQAAERPAADRPLRRPALDDAARPARQQATAQRPAAGLLSAAKQDVSAADISGSTAAPVQQHVLALVNQNRRRGGCDNLSLDRRLIDAANEHAADMARRRYFAHESPNGENAGERVKDAGYRWKRYGENIARGVDSAYEVVDGWMHSPSHRENIMDCSLHQMGIGLAIAGDDTAYWVQDFATPMS